MEGIPSVGDPAGESAVPGIAGESTGESAGDTFGPGVDVDRIQCGHWQWYR